MTFHAVTDAMDKNEMDTTLREFGRCAVALRNGLDEDKSLDEVELLFVENHFHIVQIAFLQWKRKHRPVPTKD